MIGNAIAIMLFVAGVRIFSLGLASSRQHGWGNEDEVILMGTGTILLVWSFFLNDFAAWSQASMWQLLLIGLTGLIAAPWAVAKSLDEQAKID